MSRARAIALAAPLALVGALLFGEGLWIHAKALLAQLLLERAWREMRAGAQDAKPWPWADTRPVARMSAPAQGVELIVLSGASGRTIAFGPGHVDGTPLPGDAGNSVIGGHRDSHFAFLRELQRGELLRVERTDGRIFDYRVVGTQILDKRDTWVMRDDGDPRLTLITCYPFDALRAGGPQRYIVTAKPANDAGKP